MNAVTLGMRNAFRNRTRTMAIIAILGLSIGLSLIMLISYQAVQQKITDAKESLGNTITIRPPGNTGMMGGNSNTLDSQQVEGVADVAHVKDVTEVLSDRLNTEGSTSPMGMGNDNAPKTSLKSPTELKKTVNKDGMPVYSGGGLMLAGGIPEGFSPPVSIAGSSNLTSSNTLTGGASIDITEGTKPSDKDNANEAMISEAMAKKNGLKVGDTFTAYDTELTITALFKSGTESGNNTVVVPLATLQRLSDKAGQLSTVVVSVDSLDNLKTTTQAVKNKLGDNADVTSSLEQLEKALEPLASVKNVALFSLLGSVVAGGVVILMMMVMIVRERRREIGIFKAIGASNLRIVVQFMSEALTLTLVAACFGLLIGILGGNPVTSSLVGSSVGDPSAGPGMMRPPVISLDELKNVQAHIGASVPLFGLLGAIGIALLGSAGAGWLIAKVRPAEVMRQD